LKYVTITLIVDLPFDVPVFPNNKNNRFKIHRRTLIDFYNELLLTLGAITFKWTYQGDLVAKQ